MVSPETKQQQVTTQFMMVTGMLRWYKLAGLGLVFLLSSCGHMSTEKKIDLDPTSEGYAEELKEMERRELRAAVRKRLDQVHDSLSRKQLDEAEANLRPLLKQEFFAEEIRLLQEAIQVARELTPQQALAEASGKRMLHESEKGMILPGTYGNTVVIGASLEPIELPPGPMEELVNRKVTINLDNAGIAELVAVLNQDGLNVVADDALEAAKTLTIRVQDVPLKELFSYIARNMGVEFHLGENLVWITEGDQGPGGPKLETRILRLRQGFIPEVPQGAGAQGATDTGTVAIAAEEDNDLDDVLTALMADSPEGATFRIFRNRNILVVRDSRENLRLIENLVREFDKPPYQVVIEARFMTISQNDLKDVGVEITQKLKDKNGQDLVDDHNADGPNAAKETNLLTSLGALAADAESGVGFLQLNGVLGRRAFDIAISALESKKSSTVLSSPKVTVMNNRSARIRKGDTLKYFEEFDIETVQAGQYTTNYVLVPTGTPTDLLLGITFDVRVNIGNDGRTVLLGLKPEIVEFMEWQTYASGGTTSVRLPYTYDQKVATTVGVSSGQTVVLGGMLENTKSNQVKQVPLLGDLPLIGYLFRHTEVINIPTNLLIFVTAHVINSRGEYVDVLPEQ